ncbi:MAG: ATP-sensitive inward rectifier potassium channel 10 [Cyanosarcina radialis HA8281-LM2]|jgi:inward rectifier potassium channel|nr:ATP-sensitive inward rectifier potassium channel 10 [Cyanosarcina radialis HA8281-LM2]
MRKKHRPSPTGRWLNRDGQVSTIRKGLPRFSWSDLYHLLLTLSWTTFLLLVSLLYLISNTLFAIAYLAGGDCIQNARPGSFTDAFFFSVQTMATIGYGSMFPQTDYANAIVTVEALVGLLGVAMVTGLAFARFSMPSARVLFSRVAIIAPYDRVQTLMFRVANERRNLIVEAQMTVTLVRNEVTAEGQFMRRFHDLPLVRQRTPVFAFTWTVMHPIDPRSPLYGMTPETIAEQEAEIVVTMTGIDETVSQIVHSRHSYTAQEIMWNMRFVDILSRTPEGRRAIDYTRFHDFVPIRS